MPFRELRFLLVPSETECSSEGQSDSHPEADIIQRHPGTDTENQADAKTSLHSFPL